MKEFKTLQTDFYQLSMSVVAILTDSANDKCGFEAFVRRINESINPDQDFYYFGGAKEVTEFLETAKAELIHPEFLETFISLVETKLPEDKKTLYIRLMRDKWKYLDKDFHYTVYPENAKLFPYVPAVQYYGPKFIGFLIETIILNLVNGRTGFNTKDKLDNWDNLYQRDKLRSLVSPEFSNPDIMEDYEAEVIKRAKEYRNSTSKVLLEAGYRRACSHKVANLATFQALNEGWDGTSNTSLAFINDSYIKDIGGTMAHSFVMSQRSELEAYHLWNTIYPNSTILIDTYDTMDGLNKLIEYDIKPACVRIDSEPLVKLARAVRRRLDEVGWSDVQIFLSGDLTPERLSWFEKTNVPFDRCMAGTSFANINGTETVNAEFVYKLVEFEKDGKTFYPEKKANGKDSRAGLKDIQYDYPRRTLTVTSHQKDYAKMDSNYRKAWFGYFGVREGMEIEKVDFEVFK